MVKYIETSIAVSEEDKKNMKALSVKENGEYIEFISEKLKGEKKVIYERTKFSLPVRLTEDHRSVYNSVIEKSKELGYSFSEVYRRYYKEFTKSKEPK